MRWTGSVSQHDKGGFVSYGDYLCLERELTAAQQQIAMDTEAIKRLQDAGHKAEAQLAEYERCNKSTECRARGSVANYLNDEVSGTRDAHYWKRRYDAKCEELAEAQRDAERYRYLRALWKHDHFSTDRQPNGDPEKCDAAIDAAISKERSDAN
jgi:hypothetical protein